MRRSRSALLLVVALAGCSATEPAHERARLHDDLQRRVGAALPAPEAADDAIADAVRDLLARTLDETAAVRVLVLNNHGVRATWERLAVARADLVQAGLLRNPVFDGDARFFLDGGTELELGLAQPFVDLFWRPLRERLAEHEFAAARARITGELVHIVFDVRFAFVELRAAAATTERLEQALAVAASAHQLAVELHAAGNLTDQALALERAGETRARLDLAAAELAELEAREAVSALLGLWGDSTTWTIAPADDGDLLAGLDLEHVESRAVAASLELAAARAAADASAQKAGLASARRIVPDGNAGVSAVRETGDEWGFGPHLALELPLFDGGSTREARATAMLRADLHEHARIAVEVRSTARRLRERLLRLVASERFLRDVHLPARAEVLRTTLQTYNAMQIGAFDVLRQRRLQLADEVELVRVRRDALRARLHLEQLFAGVRSEAPTAPSPAPTSTSAEPERAH